MPVMEDKNVPMMPHPLLGIFSKPYIELNNNNNASVI